MSYPSFRKCKIDAGVFWLFAVLKDTTRMAGTEGREGGGRRKRLGLKGYGAIVLPLWDRGTVSCRIR